MNYKTHSSGMSNKATAQAKPIPGKEHIMAKTLAGSYAYRANDWAVLRRWLLTGSLGNSFYETSEVSTKANVEQTIAMTKIEG